MKNKNMKINCWKLEDGNEVPMPSTATLDGFQWNGRFRITVTDDDGSLGLPFLFAANDTAIMTVETSEQKGTHTGNKKIKQILRCVPRSLEYEITCCRIRSHNGKEHVWSAWETMSSAGGIKVDWDASSCVDTFITAGIYNISGERLNVKDGLPIANSNPGHTIKARLVVLDSSISGSGDTDDKCITQILTLSNRTGGDGDVYIRTGRASIKNQLAGGTGWEPWGKLQQNIEVGQVTSLNNFIGNGIYSGVYTNGSSFFETFVMVVINNYAVAGATGQVRSISQFKYALNVDSNFSYKTRTGRGNTGIEWGSWVDLGAATTTDIQDNSITAQKLSSDVRGILSNSHIGIYTNALNSQLGGNIFDKNAVGILVNKIFKDNLGNIEDREKYNISDYMAVVPGETYVMSSVGANPHGYNADKEHVGTITATSGVFTIPEGTYWIRVVYYQGWADTFCINKGTIILPVEERTFGLVRTGKLYDGAVTKVKLSPDVQELVEKIPSLELKLIKLAGFGTLYGGSTGVTGDGQYFVSTYDKKLYVSSNFVSPNSFTTTEVPFIDGAIYTYNNELYVYNGTEVVKSNALLEKKVDNIFTDYAAITNGIPSMDTIAKTFTIPQGAYISAAGKGYVSLSNEIIVEQVGSDWSTQYIVFHLSNKTARAVYSNAALSLDDKEVIIALVRWAQGVMNGNFFSYFLNGKNVELKSLTPVRNLNSFFSDYAVLTNGTPILDTVAKTFTLPTGLYISSSALKKGFRLSNDITVEADYSSGWYTHYIVLDTAALTMRIAPSNADLNLSDTEIVVVLLRWGADTGILGGNLYSYIKDGVEIEFTPTTSLQQLKEEIGMALNAMTVSPMMYNPRINLLKDNLRILNIGNSYTTDATHYLPEIAAAAGATAGYSLYKATRSGGSFKNWVDTYNDADTDKNYLQLVAGDEMDDVVTGTGNVGDGSYFRNALLNGKWDLIIIHQASNYATDFNSWNGKTNAGYLKELIQIIRQTNPQAAIGFYLVHSYRSSYSGNTEKSSLERWRNIAAATKKMCLNYGIDFVIPYGTAVQNLRETSLNDENEFSTDGTHLADGLGDYVAACCYWQSMFAPRFGSIVGNGFRKTDLDENTRGVKNITDETASIAQKAAMWAAYNWYEVINPE